MAEKENLHMNGAGVRSSRRVQKDILGPNCEVGLKLKALYTSIQDETIPDMVKALISQALFFEEASQVAA